MDRRRTPPNGWQQQEWQDYDLAMHAVTVATGICQRLHLTEAVSELVSIHDRLRRERDRT